jgi:hypothetical protein
VIRHVFERGLASLIARWMLEGTSDALFERIAKAGALDAEQAEKLRRETRAHLEQVRDEGGAQADVVLAMMRGVLASLPDVRSLTETATRAAVHVAARAAEAAAARAQDRSGQADAAAAKARVDDDPEPTGTP